LTLVVTVDKFMSTIWK